MSLPVQPETAARETSAAGRRGWMTRGVLGIGLASLFSDWGHELGTALLPAILASLGAPAFALGVVEGVADGFSSFAKAAGGWLCDRPALRKPIAVCGYVLTAFSTFTFGFVGNWPQLVVARSIGWIGRGIRGPSRDALLADGVPPDRMGRAFGFERAMDTAGAVLGPLTATALVTALPLRAAVRWSLLPGLFAALTIGLLAPRPIAAAAAPHPASREGLFSSLRNLPRPFGRFLAAVFLFGLGDFAPTLLILRAAVMLAPQRGVVAAAGLSVALYTFHNLCYALACFPAGALGDRVNKRGLLVVSYLLAAGTFAGFLLARPNLVDLGALFGLAGVSIAMHETLEKALSVELLPAARRGSGFGALAAVKGVGDFVSSIAVGALWSGVGATAGFSYAAALTAVGAIVLLFV
jgi:MFS family permease